MKPHTSADGVQGAILVLTLVALRLASGSVQPWTSPGVSRGQVSFGLEPPHACIGRLLPPSALGDAAPGQAGIVGRSWVGPLL